MLEYIRSNNISKFLVILLFMLLFFNNETLSNNLCRFVSQPTQYVAGLIFLYFIFQCIKNRNILRFFNRNKFIAITLFFLLIFIAFVQDSGYTNGYMLLLLALFSSLILSILLSFKDFAILYVYYMSAMSIISLVCTYILKSFGSVFNIIYNSANVGFYDMYLCYVCTRNHYYRNFGDFREPGVYAIFLILALIFLMCFEKSFKPKQYIMLIVLFVVTLISTFSTTGYLAMFFVIYWYGVINKKMNIPIFFLVCIGIAILMVVSDTYISNPLDKLSATSSSFQYRMETIIRGNTLMFNRPWGYGILNGIRELELSFTMKNYHNTSTIVSMGVYVGLPYLVLYLLGLYKFCKKKLKCTLLVIPLILLISGETLIYNPYIYILCFYGFDGIWQSFEKNKEKTYESFMDS